MRVRRYATTTDMLSTRLRYVSIDILCISICIYDIYICMYLSNQLRKNLFNRRFYLHSTSQSSTLVSFTIIFYFIYIYINFFFSLSTCKIQLKESSMNNRGGELSIFIGLERIDGLL